MYATPFVTGSICDVVKTKRNHEILRGRFKTLVNKCVLFATGARDCAKTFRVSRAHAQLRIGFFIFNFRKRIVGIVSKDVIRKRERQPHLSFRRKPMPISLFIISIYYYYYLFFFFLCRRSTIIRTVRHVSRKRENHREQKKA